MKKAQDTIFRTQIDGHLVFISLVQKQNLSGLYFNERIFVLVDGRYFGYITKFQEKDQPNNLDLSKLKVNVPLSALKSVNATENLLKIRFSESVDNKRQQKSWTLRLKTKKLAQEWMQKLDEQKKKFNAQQKSSQIQTKKQLKLNSLVNQAIYKKQPSKLQIKKDGPNVKHSEVQHNGDDIVMNPLYQSSNKKQPQQSFIIDKTSNPQKEEQYFAIHNYKNRQPINSKGNSIHKNTKQQLRQSKKQPSDYYHLINRIVSDDHSNKLQNLQQSKNKSIRLSKQQLQQVHENQFKKQKQKLEYIKKSNISSSIKNKSVKDIQIIPWTYKYFTKPHSQVFQQFGNYCFNILADIIDEIAFEQRKRKFNPKFKGKNYWIYQVEDIQLKLTFISLKEALWQKQPNIDKICDLTPLKTTLLEFKNLNYLYNIIKNQGKIRVPLTSICQYKGFIGYFKVNSQFDYGRENIMDIVPDFQKISKLSKISLQTLRNPKNNLFLPLKSDFYSQFQYSKYTRDQFDYFIVQQIQSFIPIDNAPNKIKLYHRLRPEMVQNQTQVESLPGFYNLSQGNNIKIQQSHKLNYFCQKLASQIRNAAAQLDKLDFYPLNSQQLTDYLQSHGINMRYIGQIYSNIKLQFPKKIIASQIMSRVCKILLRKTLQDVHLQAHCSTYQQIDEFNNTALDKAIDFLNCVMGCNLDTVRMWKVLSIHTQDYYGLYIQPEDIDEKYFLISLFDHCSIEVKQDKLNFEDVFQKNNVLNESNTVGFQRRIKTYIPKFEEKYKKVIMLMKDQTEQNFQKCVKELNLQSEPIPKVFQMNKQYHRMKQFLTLFIQPQFSLQQKFAHLKLYEPSLKPYRKQMEIMLAQIKWYMRQRKKQKYVKACQKYIRKVNHFYGDFHPLLSQLYDLFSFYHMNQGQYEDSTTFSKSSLVTILKICGTTHLKTAQAYYQLSLCYLKSNKKQDAMNHLQKAKSILQLNGKGQSVPYAIILGKLSLINLNQSNIQLSIKLALNCLSLLDQNKSHREDQRVQAYEILARCYELIKNKEEQLRLSNYCADKLITMRTPLNLQRLLKVCLYPILSSTTQNAASLYLDIISQIPLEINTSSYGKAYEMIKARIKQNSLIFNFQSYLENMVEIQKYVREKGILKSWKNLQVSYARQTINDCLSLSEELIYFLGQGFITGSLRQSL